MIGRLIFGLIAIAFVAYILQFLALPAPFGQMIFGCLVLSAVYLILMSFGLLPGPPWWRNGPPL